MPITQVSTTVVQGFALPRFEGIPVPAEATGNPFDSDSDGFGDFGDFENCKSGQGQKEAQGTEKKEEEDPFADVFGGSASTLV